MAKKLYVALNLPKANADFLVRAKHIVACMSGNAYFPSPPLPLATVAAHVADLEAAAIAAQSRALGLATERHAKRAIVEGDLRHLGVYVETVANQTPGEAATIIVSAGMYVKGSTAPSKPQFAVKQGAAPCSARLDVRHPGAAAGFEWQYSVGGVSWLDGGRTTWAHQDIANLTQGVLYSFRFRVLTGDVLSDWSDPLTLRVG